MPRVTPIPRNPRDAPSYDNCKPTSNPFDRTPIPSTPRSEDVPPMEVTWSDYAAILKRVALAAGFCLLACTSGVGTAVLCSQLHPLLGIPLLLIATVLVGFYIVNRREF